MRLGGGGSPSIGGEWAARVCRQTSLWSLLYARKASQGKELQRRMHGDRSRWKNVDLAGSGERGGKGFLFARVVDERQPHCCDIE